MKNFACIFVCLSLVAIFSQTEAGADDGGTGKMMEGITKLLKSGDMSGIMKKMQGMMEKLTGKNKEMVKNLMGQVDKAMKGGKGKLDIPALLKSFGGKGT